MALEGVFYIDPCTQKSFSYAGKEFLGDASLSSKQFIASRLLYDDVFSHSFKVPKDTSSDEIKSLVEIKMYEDAGLDLQKEYKLTHFVKELEFEDMVLVEAYAIEKENAFARFESTLKVTKHIDLLVIPFLAFSTLYTNKIIAPDNDVFVYIDENEAFMALYKDGKYLSTKSLMTFHDMIAFLHKNGLDIEYDRFFQVLQEKGLEASLYTKEDAEVFNAFENLFVELFTKINNVIIHSRSVFGFEKVSRLFFSTSFGRIKGLKEVSANFFSSDLELLDFNLFSQKVEDDFLAHIIASYALDVQKSGVIEQDVTFFKKEPPFFASEAGKFTLFATGFFILLSIYPSYLAYDIASLEKEDAKVTKHLNALKESTKKLRGELTDLQAKLEESKAEVQVQETRIKNISQSIEDLYTLKQNQQGSSSFFSSVNQLLKKYKLATRSIALIDINTMHIEVYSSFEKRDTIAKFMKELLAQGFIGVSTKEIRLDEKSYISLVEISK